MLKQTTSASPNPPLGLSLAAFRIGGIIVLFTTWYLISIMLLTGTESWLAPWDTLRSRPPVGTWQRTINDFFEGSPGNYLPLCLIMPISLALFWDAYRHSKHGSLLMWIFALTNLLFIIASVILVPWAFTQWAPPFQAPLDAGFHRTWPAIFVTGILLIGWIVLQIALVISYRLQLTRLMRK